MKGALHPASLIHRAWLQVFVSGLVIFYLLEKLLKTTDNPDLLPLVIVVGAFLVPVTLTIFVHQRGVTRTVPLLTVAVCFLWGGIIGVSIAGFIEYETLRDLGVFGFLGVGAIEESAKLVVPLLIFVRGRYRAESDGLLFGVASGMGFAALETIGYAFVTLIKSHGNVGPVEEILLIRGLMSPAGHAAWTGLITATLWRERQRIGHAAITSRVIGAYLLAVVLHALWDSLIAMQGFGFVPVLGLNLLSLGVATISLTLLIRRVRESRRFDTAFGPGAAQLPA